MPALFEFPGGIPVYASSVLVGFGATLGLAWIAWQSPPELKIRHLDASLWSLLGALVGGRIAFVLLNWHYYQLNPGEIPLIYLGGFSWVGALLGGLLSLILFAAINRYPLENLVDALLPLVGTLFVSGWLGCWVDGHAYGRLTDAWWGLPAKDEWGIISAREPIQLLGALSSLTLIGLLVWGLTQRAPPGVTASLGLLGLSLIMLLLSFLRADPDQSRYGLRLGSWMALVVLVISGIALLLAVIKGVRNKSETRNRG
jgi:phosphatidylglycerol:prolipoprotein diacylglycerol transferase